MIPDAPSDWRENRLHRKKVFAAAMVSSEMRAAIWQKCKNDMIWWLASSCWIYEPRTKSRMPWIPWDFQIKAMRLIKENLGKKTIWIEKSRDMGATWMVLAVIQHEWQFGADSTWMLVSRNEALVDRKGDSDSLFWKLDFLRENQPPFLLPVGKFDRLELMLRNRRQNVMINGASTTADVGRGGRRTGIFMDEFGAFGVPESNAVLAATASNTDCQIMCSTYKGATGAFYDSGQRSDDDIVDRKSTRLNSSHRL